MEIEEDKDIVLGAEKDAFLEKWDCHQKLFLNYINGIVLELLYGRPSTIREIQKVVEKKAGYGYNPKKTITTLIKNGWIAVEGDKYSITKKGTLFVEYLKNVLAENKPEEKA